MTSALLYLRWRSYELELAVSASDPAVEGAIA